LQIHACKAVHPNCKLLAQDAQLNRWNPADQHSPCRARDPGPDHRGAIFAFYTNSIKKYNEKEKHGKKHSFSDAKHFTDFNFAEMFY
jgi:hypothetical protein